MLGRDAARQPEIRDRADLDARLGQARLRRSRSATCRDNRKAQWKKKRATPARPTRSRVDDAYRARWRSKKPLHGSTSL
jgi:hypothetical protein